MKTYTMHMILFWLMIAGSISSVPDFTSTVRKLHQPATLSCEGKCSGSGKWTKIQKPSPDVVVAQCNQTSCSSEEGFIVSHDQFMEGNLSLTIIAADYSKRSWYTCQCDGRDVCVRGLRIEPVEFMNAIRPGEPLVIDLQIPQRVEVILNRSGGADGGQSSVSVTLCTVDGRNVQCDPEYEKTVSFKCSLTVSAVKQTDSSVYTVRDTDNHEIIATYTSIGNITDANNTLPAKGKLDSWNLKRIFEEEYRGVIVGLCLCLAVFGTTAWIVKGCRFIEKKVKKCWRGDGDHSTVNVESDPGESIKLHVNDKGSLG